MKFVAENKGRYLIQSSGKTYVVNKGKRSLDTFKKFLKSIKKNDK
jgi:hypothetical protein|tara:strand:- start:1566 stop:1700 length:135 start_codon:yes stop_codon:yes gene_type:complete